MWDNRGDRQRGQWRWTEQQAREQRGVYWESEVSNRKHRSPGVVVMSEAGEKCQASLSKSDKDRNREEHKSKGSTWSEIRKYGGLGTVGEIVVNASGKKST